MAKRTLSVQIDGQTFTRQTAADYSHVVAWRQADGKVGVAQWCKSEKNAKSAMAGFISKNQDLAAWAISQGKQAPSSTFMVLEVA